MFNNMSKALFLFMVFMGTILTISSNSWLSIWMGLEINLLSFIPLMVNKNNLNNSEATLNYFLIQAFASTIIMFSMILSMLWNNNITFMLYEMSTIQQELINIPMLMMTMTLMLKLGAAPFHMWFPNVMENLSWINNLILMTWQKLAPMLILSYLIKLKSIFMLFIILSTLIGAIGGLNQLSLRKLLAFSSINHVGWMISAIMYNENIWTIYFTLYSFLNISIIMIFKIFQIFYMNQLYSMFFESMMLKFLLMISLLSLGGLPPFLGFIPKWMIIQSMVYMNMNMLTLFMIMMSLITLFYYLKITFSAILFNYKEFIFPHKNNLNNSNFALMLMINFISLSGMFMFIEMIYGFNL